MSLDLPTLTLIGGVIVTPVLGAIGFWWRHQAAERAAETKRYLDKIDALQERLFTMQEDRIKAEVLRAAAAADSSQTLKTLAAAVDALTKPKVAA